MSLRLAEVTAQDGPALTALFTRIAADPTATRFHPHPFTPEMAERRAEYSGGDVYALLHHGADALAYGLLRGWEEGYAVPSLGIYVAETLRGTGAARLMMNYLHLAARLRGAPAVRLKVYPDNQAARRLYESLGYRFADGLEKDQLVGRLEF